MNLLIGPRDWAWLRAELIGDGWDEATADRHMDAHFVKAEAIPRQASDEETQ